MSAWLSPLAARRLRCVVYEIGTGIARVVPTGTLGAGEERELASVIGSLDADIELIVVDLRELASIDRAGARVLGKAAAAQERQGRRLVLVNRPAERAAPPASSRLIAWVRRDREVEASPSPHVSPR